MRVKFSRPQGWYLFILPCFYLLVYAMLMGMNGPFYLSRIDPDYVYLLNGMNCSILHFDRIGHLDHPGTPFQIFVGLSIDLIYLISGKQGIVHDVFSRPEHYLNWSSHFLACIGWVVIACAGKIGEKYEGKAGAMLLQLSPFLSPVMLDLSVRLMPDRLGYLLVFVLMLLLVDVHYSQRFQVKRKSNFFWGVLTGVILAIKINFLPIAFVPLFLVKYRWHYLLGSITGFVVGTLPVIGRLSDFSRFTTKVLSHDGIYGTGGNQFVDFTLFTGNVWIIVQTNVLLILILLSMILILLKVAGSVNDRNNINARIYLAFTLAITLSIIIVAKHYKNYYMAPILMTMGAILFIIYRDSKIDVLRKSVLIIALLFSVFSIYRIFSAALNRVPVIKNRLEVTAALRTMLPPDAYLAIKPEWIWGPAPEYGLIFGLSYVRHRDRFADQISPLYPHVLSFEGRKKPFWNMRVAEVPDSTLLTEGRPILVLDQKGRDASPVIAELESRLDYMKVDSSTINGEMTLYFLHKNSFGHGR